MATFSDLPIARNLLAALDAVGFREPTPIQQQAIPIALEGKDVIGIAQTGTGKTLAFGIPMIQRIGQLPKPTGGARGARGLALLPTRELASQVATELLMVGGKAGLRVAVVIGGESEGKQLRDLRNNPHIIVATPGRLVDYIERGQVLLGDVAILVLDEADRMFDMGFAPQLRKILRAVPRQRQTMLFSATMPADIVQLAKEHMGWPVRVEVAPSGTAAERVEQELFIVPRAQKIALLAQVLAERSGSVILFSRTKYGARNLTRRIERMGHTAVEIHGNRSQAQRVKALEGFKRGTYRILVATDIAARGLDVKDVQLIINFDLPMTAEDYVHRIGRTARAGRGGSAVSFATPEQAKDVHAIERLIRKQLPRRPLPKDLPAEQHAATEDRPRGPRPPFRGGSRRPQGHGAPFRRGGDRRPSRPYGGQSGSRPSGGVHGTPRPWYGGPRRRR